MATAKAKQKSIALGVVLAVIVIAVAAGSAIIVGNASRVWTTPGTYAGPSSGRGIVATCVDGDSGDNIMEKATVTLNGVPYVSDYCAKDAPGQDLPLYDNLGREMIVEHECDQEGDVKVISHPCPVSYLCEFGECMSQDKVIQARSQYENQYAQYTRS